MKPIDLPPDNLDRLHAELFRPAEVRKTYLSNPPGDEHHEHVHPVEEPRWRVMPIRRGEPTMFFGAGTYLLLHRPDYVTVYLQNNGSRFIGKLGECELPESFPTIKFPEGVDQVAVVPVSGPAPHVGKAVWEPNLRIIQ